MQGDLLLNLNKSTKQNLQSLMVCQNENMNWGGLMSHYTQYVAFQAGMGWGRELGPSSAGLPTLRGKFGRVVIQGSPAH